MDKKLQELLYDFNRKFAEAQDARLEIMNYLEENYDIDVVMEQDILEDENDWCYGIDIEGVEKLIRDK